MMMLGARMSAYTDSLKGGPLAFVSTSEAARATIDRYINLTARADRPTAVFRTRDRARAWIDAGNPRRTRDWELVSSGGTGTSSRGVSPKSQDPGTVRMPMP